MFRVDIERTTSATADEVLDSLREGSPERRHRFWSNVTPARFELHDSGPGFIEVTEATFVVGRFWERSRYEWPEAGRVTGTVLDSNVFQPGSTWEVRAFPAPGGGSRVEVSVRRRFRPGPKGLIARTANHLGGRRLFGWYIGTVLRAVEAESSASSSTALD